MKFKYISGDFVTEYNRTLQDLKEEQAALDEKYSKQFDRIINMEVSRLEQVVPNPFEAGINVKCPDGRIGTVLNCPVEICVRDDEDYHGPLYGPGKYYSLSTKSDETVITCEGMIRQVVVEFEATELDKDWGIDKRVEMFWPDELTEIL